MSVAGGGTLETLFSARTYTGSKRDNGRVLQLFRPPVLWSCLKPCLLSSRRERCLRLQMGPCPEAQRTCAAVRREREVLQGTVQQPSGSGTYFSTAAAACTGTVSPNTRGEFPYRIIEGGGDFHRVRFPGVALYVFFDCKFSVVIIVSSCLVFAREPEVFVKR